MSKRSPMPYNHPRIVVDRTIDDRPIPVLPTLAIVCAIISGALTIGVLLHHVAGLVW